MKGAFSMGGRYQNIMVTIGVLIAAYQAYLMQRGPQPGDPPLLQTAASHPVGGLVLVAGLFIIAGLLNATPFLSQFFPKRHPSTNQSEELTNIYADVILDWLKLNCHTVCKFTTEAMAADVKLSVDRAKGGLEKLEQLKLVSKDMLSWTFSAANAISVSPQFARWRPPSPEPKPDAACESLKAIANSDLEKISERIKQINQRLEFHFNPGTDPSIDIVTELWNGSVFELVNFGEISGHATYVGRQIAADPRIIVSVEPVLLNLKHAEKLTLVVRQYLSPEMADMMEANRNRQMLINFENVYVSFKILPMGGGSTKSFSWFGPRFAIEDTVRV
jgi:hypothetical protein